MNYECAMASKHERVTKKNWNICGKGGYGVCVCAGWREMIDGVQ